MAIKEVLWRVKQNVGPHIYKGKTYACGDTFKGTSDLLGRHPDKLEPANAAAAKVVNVAAGIDGADPEPEASLKVVHKGGGRYDVINIKSGKSINEELLGRKEAYALVTSVESEVDESAPEPDDEGEDEVEVEEEE